MLTTKTLQDNLKHCIGRKTVRFENNTVYHFGTPIIKISGGKIIMTYAYDYSASTSRVRNAALRLLTGTDILTRNLQAAERNGEVLSCGCYNVVFESWE